MRCGIVWCVVWYEVWYSVVCGGDLLCRTVFCGVRCGLVWCVGWYGVVCGVCDLWYGRVWCVEIILLHYQMILYSI